MPGDVDYFVAKLQAGTNVAIQWRGHPSLPAVNGWTWVVSVLDSNGVAFVDADATTDSVRFMWYSPPRTGRYFIRLGMKPTWATADPTGDYAYSMRVVAVPAKTEREPNGDTATADLVAIGDTIAATLASRYDSDFFAIDLPAGTKLKLDVAAVAAGCPFIPEMKLLTSDGTELARAESSPYDGSWNPLLEYRIPVSGQYFVSVSAYEGPEYPTNPTCYFLKVGTFTPPPPGPADPIHILAQVGRYDAIASSRTGDVYVASGICETPERVSGNKVARLEGDGSLTTIADQLALTGDIAVDASGNVLVPGVDSHHGVVWRFSPSGERSVLVLLPSAPCALAVGPDGDVWVTEYATGHTMRLDSLGNAKATAELGTDVSGLKVSPSGVLYYRRNGSLFKLENGDTTRLMGLEGLQAWTFDHDGNLYVTSYNEYYGDNLHNKLILLNPALQSLLDPVAYANYPVGMTFVPDSSGRPTRRLLVLYHPDGMQGDGVIGELNPAGVRAPGP
ncbi:MAG TPA: pre-peptidase C-terminal domain-containing protein [Gemmatimonadales bacterium]|nr:pre-peptidase C-terminal domain-containing protein [Gemmatimonadales bacterium]